MSMTAMKINGYNWYLPAILIFGLFMATLHPTITAGDSGEIAAAAFSLGIPHPPGYPLYVTIGKLFTLILPLGNMAYRVNIVSAMFGVASCWMVYLVTLKIAGAGLAPAKEGQPQGLPLRLPALFAALSLALSYEFWYRSTAAEVYTLNAFLVLMITYVLLVWREKNSGQWPVVSGQEMLNTSHVSRLTSHNLRLLYLAALLLGLGIGNHHTIVLITPGAIAFICLVGSRGFGARSKEQEARSYAAEGTVQSPPRSSLLALRFLLLTFFFLLGLSIYLYLPVRSFKNPFMDWGDPQNLRNFMDVFTRKSYLPQAMERGWGMLVGQLKTFNPVHEFTFIGFLFGLFGIRGLWKADKVLAAMLLVTFTLTSYGLILLAGSSTKDVDILKKFYLPAYTVFSVFMGIGIATALKSEVGSQKSEETPHSLLFTPYSLRLTLLSLAAASLIWQLAYRHPLTRNSDSYLAYDYGMNELKSLRTGSVYINKGDIKTFPLWYLQGVERYREDVKVVAAYFLTQGWYAEETLQLVASFLQTKGGSYNQMLVDALYRGNAGKGAYTGFLDEEYIPGRLLTQTHGITFMLHETAEEKHEEDVWPLYQLRGVSKIERDMERGVIEIFKDYASSYYNTGLRYYSEGETDRAIMDFEKAVAINPEDPDSLNNLAALYADKGIRLKEAEVMARRAIELYATEEDKGLAAETLKEIQKRQKEKEII